MQKDRERTFYATVVAPELIAGAERSGDLYGGYGYVLDAKQEDGIGLVTFIYSSAF